MQFLLNVSLFQGKLLDEYYNSALEARSQSRNVQDAHNISKTEARFTESLRKTCKHIVDGFEGVNSENNKLDSSEDYFSDIKTWQETFDSRVTNLQLDTVHDELVKTLNFAVSAFLFQSFYTQNIKVEEIL